jgi:hypothetical protein
MKGGSVASSAVEGLVKPTTYEHLNSQFDNLVGGAKGKKNSSPKPKSSTKKATEKKAPSKPTAKTSQSQKGGICMICGGAHMKHINEYNDQGLQKVYNKKGGSNPLYTIKYDISTAFTQPAYGDVTSRSVDAATLKHMSYESPSSWTPYSKFVQYGNVTGTPQMKFEYSGGKASKKDTKTSSKSSDKSKKTKVTKVSK